MFMRTLCFAIAAAALAACSPQAETALDPEQVVLAIYDTAQTHVGREATPRDAIPMSDDLKALLDSAGAQAQARGEPFIDGDLALNCQDCTSVSDATVQPTQAPPENAASGHVWVEAQFTLNGDEPRTALYDMVETTDGWRVDNIIHESFDLRAEASRYLAESGSPDTPPAP